MKKLAVEARLEYARAGVSVIRKLQSEGSTMAYAQFARAIALLPEGQKWDAWYRSRTTEILNLISAAEEEARPLDAERLDYSCIVGARTGRPGVGFHRESRIVRGP